MRHNFFGVVTLGGLSLGMLAGCSGGEPPAPQPGFQPLANSIVFGEFVAHVNPKGRSLTFERVSEPRAYGPNLEPLSLDNIPIVSDGVTGSGPANTVELSSANCVDNPPATFACDVTLTHFYSRSFSNTMSQVTSITDTSGNPLINHQGINGDGSQFGLDGSLGLWFHTNNPGVGTPAGVLGQSPNNSGTRTYTFNNPDDASDNISFAVYSSLSYGSYNFTFANSTYADACSGGTSSASSGVITATMPFDFTLWNTNSTTAKFTARTAQIAIGGANPGASQVPLALPSTSAPHPMIFAFWEALKLGTGGQTCFQTIGTAPNRQFLIEWRNLTFASGAGSATSPAASLDFEAYLFEGTSEIDFVYNTMTGNSATAGRENGALATVGTQDQTATSAAGEHNTEDFGSGNAWAFVPAPF